MIRPIATLLIVALVGWVGVVSAQQAPPPAAPPAGQAPTAAPAAAEEKIMEGKLKVADRGKKQLTLEDGTVFMVPTAVQVSWAELQPGKIVAVSFTQVGEQKTVKKIEVK